jgi:hypothetical protein
MIISPQHAPNDAPNVLHSFDLIWDSNHCDGCVICSGFYYAPFHINNQFLHLEF